MVVLSCGCCPIGSLELHDPGQRQEGSNGLSAEVTTVDGVLWLPSNRSVAATPQQKMKREELDQQGVFETSRGKRSSWRFAPAMHNPKCMPEKLLKQRIMFIKAGVHDDREAAMHQLRTALPNLRPR